MSVWEQRTSQLRRHRQMSSREILFSSPSEEHDGAPGCQPQRKPGLSPSDSKKQAIETSATTALPEGTLEPPMPLDIPLDDKDQSLSIPEPPLDIPIPESPMVVDMSLPEPPVTLNLPETPESKTSPETTLDVNNHCPRLNGNRRQRAVRKYRPPAMGDTLTPDMGPRPRRLRHREPHTDARGKETQQGEGAIDSRDHRPVNDEDESKSKNDGEIGSDSREAEQR